MPQWKLAKTSIDPHGISGSLISDNAELRRFSIAANLAHRSYISSTLLDTFIKDIPKVTQKHVDDLREKDEWKTFIGSCIGGKKSNLSTYKSSSDSNKEEFKAYFRKPKANNPRRGNYSSIARQKELKPDLITIVVKNTESQRPRETQPKFVRLAKPQTILPPPNSWKPAPMDNKYFPIVECREPECKRNSQDLKNAKVYLNCALKAAEALRYQWSRRYVYCFLHCGSIIQLLHFDRSGLIASELLDIQIDTANRLGYPARKEAPFHKYDPDNRLRATVAFKAKLCYKRHYLSSLQNQPNIVELLAYGVVKVENENNTTVFRRQCSSRQPMTFLETFYDRAKHTGNLMALLYNLRRPKDIAFSAIKVMAKRGIVHRDILFTNIRIDNQYKLKVCDLDIAASINDQGIGAQDRTSTLYTINLLSRNLITIINPGAGINLVRSIKREVRLKAYASLNTLKDSEFASNNYINDYESAEEGTENVCFDRSLDSGVKQAIEGIAKTLLSL
ncbi:hypothetical protein V2W45_1401204 [Cenococcum geophilum]